MAAINIINSPALSDGLSLRPAESPLVFEFDTEIFPLAPLKAEIRLRLSGVLLQGESLTINNVTIFSAAPNPLFNQLPTSALALPSVIAARLVNILQANTTLNNDYLIFTFFDGLDWIVTLQAKLLGTAYDIDFTTTSSYFGIDFLLGGNDINRGMSLPGYRIYVQPYRRNLDFTQYPFAWTGLGDAVRLPQLVKYWTQTNRIYFDLSALLRPALISAAPDYSAGNTVFRLAPDAIIQYALEYGETYNDTIGEVSQPVGYIGVGAESNPYFLGLAALPAYFTQTQIDDYFSDYWSADPLNGQTLKFLTNQPTRKLTQPGLTNSEYLYFYNRNWFNARGAFMVLRCEIWFNDGTMQVYTSNPADLDSYSGLVVLNLSPSVLALPLREALAGQPVNFYSVQVLTYIDPDITYAVTETRYIAYNNDNRCNESNPLLHFLNPLGGYDSWYFQGYEKTIPVNPTLYNKGIINQYIPTNDRETQVATLRMDGVVTYILSSGWVNQEHYLWLRDLLSSTEVYMYLPTDLDNSIFGFRRVNIADSDWEFDNMNDMYNLRLTVTAGYLPNNITQ